MSHSSLQPVAESLVEQYTEFTSQRVESASLQDVRLSPRDQASQEQLLRALRLVASHTPSPLLDTLLYWRSEALKCFRGNNILSSLKKLMIESAYLEAVLEVVDGASGNGIHGLQASSLLKLAFQWILRCQSYVPENELERPRSAVTMLCGRLLGGMTPVFLSAITENFIKELRARLGGDGGDGHHDNRAALFRLCEAMKSVRLGFGSDEEVVTSIKFLEDMHPLKYVAKEKKSQVHHALCDMLVFILRRLATSGQVAQFEGDSQILDRWCKTVAHLRANIFKWAVDQKKHYAVGYPLVAVLLSLEPEANFSTEMQSLVDQIHSKVMRDSKTRPVTLHCLQECAHMYLERCSGSQPKDRLHVWLRDCFKAPLVYVVKGSLSLDMKPGQDLGATMLGIFRVLFYYVPEYAVEVMLELLRSDIYTCQSVALQALRNMILSAPARASSGADFDANQPVHHGALQEVVDMMRLGQSPLEVCGVGHLERAIGEALGRTLTACASLFGSYHIFTVQRSISDHVPRERLPGLKVLEAALQCLPFVRPSWSEQAIAESLASYTKHAYHKIRTQAIKTMYRTIWCRASMRPAVVVALAKDIINISDEHAAVIDEQIRLLIDLCGEWLKLLQAEADDPLSSVRNEQHAGLAGQMGELQKQLEALGLVGLASPEPNTRAQALELLRVVRTLHGSVKCLEEPNPGKREPSRFAQTVYIIDVIDQVGGHIASSCYWDFGRFSDLWRDWQPLPTKSSVDFAAVLSNFGKEHMNESMRWARCLAALVRHASKLCPEAVSTAYGEVSARCQKLVNVYEGGQTVFRVSGILESPGRQQLWRNYAAFACACPPTKREAPRRGITHQNMMRLIIATVRASQELHSSSFLALGNSHVAIVPWLLDEVKKATSVAENDKNKGKLKVPANEVRVAFGHAVRVIASGIPRAELLRQDDLMNRLLDWVISTTAFCQRGGESMYWDLVQLRYCCCSVIAACADPMEKSAVLGTARRKALFSTFDMWQRRAAELSQEIAQNTRLQDLCSGSRELQVVFSKVKDTEALRTARRDLQEQADALHIMGCCAMAALLAGPSLDNDQRLQGLVGAWVSGILRTKRAPPSTGPSYAQVAHMALFNLLNSNISLVAPVIDRCYPSEGDSSNHYFHVLAEVLSRNPEMPLPPHIILSLILYKLVDPSADVRDDALDLLNVTTSHLWGASKFQISNSVISNLKDSYQQFQNQTSTQMAAEHPEISEQLCVEMLTRALTVPDKPTRHQVLISLRPWMENLSFAGRESSWSNDLLKSLYFVTWQHGMESPHEIELLWRTLAGNRRNIIPVLDFLINKGLDEAASGDLEPMSSHFSVAKRVCLYLARVASQQTVDHLVFEISQQLYEEDGSYTSASQAAPQGFFAGAPPPPPPASDMYGDSDSESSESGPPTPGVSSSLLPKRLSSTGSAFARASLSLRSPSSVGALRREGSLGSRSVLSSVNPGRTVSDTSDIAHMSGRELLTRPLTRSELALCLVAEVACEHDEDFRSHLPVLFHVALICMDASEPIVSYHCNLLLVNILYSVSARHLSAGGGGGGGKQEETLEQVSSVIRRLQDTRGRRLWRYEEATLEQPRLQSFETLQGLVDSLLGAIVVESDLRGRWGEEALSWAVEGSSRHLSMRSLQVFRALRLPLNSHSATSLCHCLHHVLSKAAKEDETAALECALEIVLSLQTLVDSTPAAKLVLYPQLFWACIALLPTPFPPLYREALLLWSQVLHKMDLSDVAVQNVLMAAAPGSAVWDAGISLAQSPKSMISTPSRAATSPSGSGAHAPWGDSSPWRSWRHLVGPASRGVPAPQWQALAVQQLLIKGLFHSDCELLSVKVLTRLAGVLADPTGRRNTWKTALCLDSVSSCEGVTVSAAGEKPESVAKAGIAAVLGPSDVQLVFAVAGLLPWLLVSVSSRARSCEGARSCAVTLACAARSLGHEDLAELFQDLSGEGDATVRETVSRLSSPLAAAFFPEHARTFCQLLLCIVSYGRRVYHDVALLILESVLQVQDAQLGHVSSWIGSRSSFAPVLQLVGQAPGSSCTPKQALAVLDALLRRAPTDQATAATSIKDRWQFTAYSISVVRREGRPEGLGNGSGEGRAETREGRAPQELLEPPDGLQTACAALSSVLGTCHKAFASRVGKRGFMPFCNFPER